MHSRQRPASGPRKPADARSPAGGGGGGDGIRRLGRYEVLVRLAAGGAANVFLVRDPKAVSPGQLLALKVLLPSLSSNEDFLNMFFSEARIAARLHHPNVVSIAGFGQNDGIHCMAMEYVFGASLSQVLKQSARVKKPLTVGVLLRITATICDALHYAHELRGDDNKPMGLVHRDVTPQNILIGFNGVPKLTDFGIAKATGRGWETQAGIVKGKFSYMSPEQALGRKIDRRSDIFCTGIVLWEALTGKELFKGTSPMEVIEAIREQPIEPPSKVVPGLSPIVDPIVMKALKRTPRQRYQTAAEMRKEIEDLIDRAGVKIDAQTISKEFTEIFGETIVERAFALRAAMAGRADLDDLAKALGGQRLKDEHLPMIAGGASHPDPLGLFGDAQGSDDDFAIDEADQSDAMPARQEQEFTRAFSKITLDKIEVPEPAASPEPEADLIGFDIDDAPETTGSGEVMLDGWEDNTRMHAPSDELLAMIAEGDATVGVVSAELAERLGLNQLDEEEADRTLTGYDERPSPFDEEFTMDAGRPGILHEHELPKVSIPSSKPVPAGASKPPPPTAPSTAGRAVPLTPSRGVQPSVSRAPVAPSIGKEPAAVVLRGVSPKHIAAAETIQQPGVRGAGSRPFPRAPSLDMQEAVTPRPELEMIEEQPLPKSPGNSIPVAPPSSLPVAKSKSVALSNHGDSLATALDEVSSASLLGPIEGDQSAEESLPPVDPSPLDDPEDGQWDGVQSMPGSAAMRALSTPHKPAIVSLSGLEASLAPGEALRQITPELSPDALRELIASDQRGPPARSSADGWGGSNPNIPPANTVPLRDNRADPQAVRLKPAGLIMLAVLFVALGVVLGVIFVKLLFAT